MSEHDDHAAFMDAFHSECDRLGIKRPHIGDYFAGAFRSCHKDLWPSEAPQERKRRAALAAAPAAA